MLKTALEQQIERERLNKVNPQFGDPCHTLGTDSRNYVVYSPVCNILLDDQGGQQISVRTDGKSPTLWAESHGNVPCVMDKAITYDARGNGDGETVNTLTGDHENRITDYSSVVIEGKAIPIHDPGNPMNTLTSTDRHAVAYGINCRNFTEYPELYPTLQAKPNGGQSLNFSGAIREYAINGEKAGTLDANYYKGCGMRGGKEREVVAMPVKNQYIVRRLTPAECARLQGFPDFWGHISQKEDFTDDEYRFWLDVRNTHAEINGKTVKEYTKKQMLTWYNKLHTDSAEYKMWGNGIALPPALYCMQGVAEVLKRKLKEVEE